MRSSVVVLPLLILASQSDQAPGRQDLPASTASSVGWRGMLLGTGERWDSAAVGRDTARLECPMPVDRPDRAAACLNPLDRGKAPDSSGIKMVPPATP